MSASIHTVDKFGRRRNKNKPIRTLVGFGFKLTSNGHYNMENKCLTNILEPENNGDVTTKHYVDNVLDKLQQIFSKIFDKDMDALIRKLIHEEVLRVVHKRTYNLNEANHDVQKCREIVKSLNNKLIQLEKNIKHSLLRI